MALDNKKIAAQPIKEVYAVSRLVREARGILEGALPLIWVEGELSNLAMPASGHIYFTLKDKLAQVRCAMFKSRNRQLRFTPENGMQLLMRVRVTLYEERGEFQLVVEHMEQAGSGALQRAYEALKYRLSEQGLFDEQHKLSLPTIPSNIGIVSSPDGAAVHDILTVLKRRFPAANVIIYPVAVQGQESATQIADAILLADKRQECDVLIVGRGGGSLEDLWAFNDEKLAHVVFACTIPIISAVGHEIDFTIIDFVADVRAPTPSAAAEIAVPDRAEWLSQMGNYYHRLQLLMRHYLTCQVRHLNQLQKRLIHPGGQISQQMQRLDQLSEKLCRACRQIIASKQQRLIMWRMRLKRPQDSMAIHQVKLGQMSKQLHYAIQHILRRHKEGLGEKIRMLKAVSPLNTLERGYSIATLDKTEKVLTSVDDVQLGQFINVRLQYGKLHCKVQDISDD